MIKVHLLLSLIFFSSLSFAQEPKSEVKVQSVSWKFSAFLVNPEIRFEKSQESPWTQRNANGFAIAFRKNYLAMTLETAEFSEKTGNATLNIKREHRDWLLGGRYYVLSPSGKSIEYNFFGALALGFSQETVRTNYQTTTVVDGGNRELMGSLGLGAEAIFLIDKNFGFVLGVEARALMGKNFDPKPQPSGLLRAGFQF